MCALTFKEVVSHRLNNRLTLRNCLLVTSKAFDLVHYGKLFRILMSKQIPKCDIRLFLDSYIQLEACVPWTSIKSSYITLSNGGRKED